MAKKPLFKTEAELVSLLKLNHEAAFEYLYDHYAPALYGIVCKIVKDDITGQDVMQDAFFKIWKNIQSYDVAKGTIFTWMLNIARHSAIDAVRSNRKFENNVNWSVATEDELMRTSTATQDLSRMDLATIMSKLSLERRKILDLVYIQGYTHQEVADNLKMPLGTVKSRIRKALADLRVTFSPLKVNYYICK